MQPRHLHRKQLEKPSQMRYGVVAAPVEVVLPMLADLICRRQLRRPVEGILKWPRKTGQEGKL